MWLVAKNSSLLSPDLTLILLPISLRNLRVLGSIGPRTSMHIGKNSIEGRAFPYFFIFSSAALAAAKPHSLLVSWIFSSTQTRRNRCNKHEIWLVAKNSSLLSPGLTLIILHISLRNLRVLGSIGPRTSMHIGKNSIEGRAFPYFFHFLVYCPGRGQTTFFTCQVYVSFGEGARDRNIPRQTSAGSPRNNQTDRHEHFVYGNVRLYRLNNL
ncbi:hypothetical protein HELRODRAFT_182204 [Helobdella robusta]|uniref:Uncharacterized protein n=1 Tax=Helobdella robusta TaxID=6412 RepID=T1FHX4_HELRO|nr:hypothetical protein HELRODRAFT_182204 [Helobdella robusta]ESN91128.1 hypothetical protein HELRODRAFT_182204 [Helobdella robusta]